MSASQEDPADPMESNCMKELDPTAPLKVVSVEQMLNSTPDVEMHIPKYSTAHEKEPDTEMNTSQGSSPTEPKSQQIADSDNLVSQDNYLDEKDPMDPVQTTDVEMANSKDSTAVDMDSTATIETRTGTRYVLNRITDFTVKITQESTTDEQRLEDTEDSKLINSEEVTANKEDSKYQDNTTIKKDLDHTISIAYQEVKQEHDECKTFFLKDGLQRGVQLPSIQDQEHQGAHVLGSLRDFQPSAKEITDENFQLGEEMADPAFFHKRKQLHEESKSSRELCKKLTEHMEDLNRDQKANQPAPKRQKLSKTSQQEQEQKHQARTKAARTNGRGDSARNLIQKTNYGSAPTILTSLIGANSVDALRMEKIHEKASEVKAKGWGQQFRRLLANCPKTSDDKKNRSDLGDLEMAVKNFGKKLKAVDGVWMLNGMISSLLHHQIIGVDWMLGREQSLDGCKGGILADSMGLGKTVQTLATMVANLPTGKPKGQNEERHKRSTLIIAGPSLLAQWASEIDKHTSERVFRGVIIYDAKRAHRITDSDIILASYGDVTRSCPFPEKDIRSRLRGVDRDTAKGMEAAEVDSAAVEKWIENRMHEAKDLHKVEWYRIVIDEAHKIKNHESRISYAVNALKGKHRWALSGTPIMNSYEELYPYFRFFREPEAKSLQMFRANFCNIEKKPENLKRLDNALARLLLSRTMDHQFMGRPIIDLPQTHQYDDKLELSPQEQILYKAMEGRFIKELNEALKDPIEGGDEETRYCQKEDEESDENDDCDKDSKSKKEDKQLKDMLIGLTRLRQMTAHPLLAEQDIQEIFDIPELEAIYQQLLNLNQPKNLIFQRIGVLIQQKKHGYIEYAKREYHGAICHICWDMAVDARVIPLCKHHFCKSCIERYAEVEVAQGKDEPECPTCHASFDTTALKEPSQLRKSKKPTKSPISKSEKKAGKKSDKKTKKIKQKGVDYMGNLPVAPFMPWLADFDSDSSEMPPSSKLTALVKQIQEWIATAPSDKIIIFTQWRAFAAIVGRVLEGENIHFVYFTGDMTIKSRQDATAEFRSNPSVKIMVATLKTAGEGLNLEFANRVISTDLWWNACAERQAFARVYRIGQHKETHFNRLIVSDSIDDRILDMQTQKLAMVDQVMKPKMSRLEMAKLFGRARKDRNGGIEIEASSDKKVEGRDFNESGSEEAEDEPDTKLEDSDSDESYTGEI
ncbi:SNF2 family N-terminal domain-containing protein [Leptodontidium sp. MPI-SDFR-AT-0119]|nr:SNF2 family N-terminal domain-containing protein [Leptodontidium sp. MPI-SDFR-AT-0119]